ncbi:MAG TPA: isoprenylcysteine carboxylmethyltransferase family protein [Vicinamibacterales bacterium]|nr:isoprenylcysteine carboxylmethyltransferase family protein [Vicinamibacterales bacterium]
MLARALLAFLLLPGVVAFVVPALLLDAPPWARSFDPAGFLPLTPGVVLLVWCVTAVYRDGGGTLAPWDPPRTLVVSGPYRVSRNPMYVAVVLVLLGWAVGYRSPGLMLYAVIVAIVFHVRVIVHEESFLERTHGEAWTRFRAAVPRWIGGAPTSAARQTLGWLVAGLILAIGTPVQLAFARGLEGYLLQPAVLLGQAMPYLVAASLWLPTRARPLPAIGRWTAIALCAAAGVVYVPMLAGWVPVGGDMVAVAFVGIALGTTSVVVLTAVVAHVAVFVGRKRARRRQPGADDF